MPRTFPLAPTHLALGAMLCAALLLGGLPPAAAQSSGSNAANAVTKCQGGGRTSYSQDGRCPPGTEAVDMTRPALSQADAQPVAPSPAPPVAPAPAATPKGKTAPRHAGPAADSYAAEARRKRARHCESLARQLRLVDERAAQPMAAAAQDRLREQRRHLQQQQTEERCP